MAKIKSAEAKTQVDIHKMSKAAYTTPMMPNHWKVACHDHVDATIEPNPPKA